MIEIKQTNNEIGNFKKNIILEKEINKSKKYLKNIFFLKKYNYFIDRSNKTQK